MSTTRLCNAVLRAPSRSIPSLRSRFMLFGDQAYERAAEPGCGPQTHAPQRRGTGLLGRTRMVIVAVDLRSVHRGPGHTS
jgi:hypothetical protein